MMSPVRTASPVLGSVTGTVSSPAMICGFVHVAPSSVDLVNATLPADFLNGGLIRSKKSYSVPSCELTTIWLPIVCWRDGTLTMTDGELHVRPPSTVFENIDGPRNAAVCRLRSEERR